MKRSSSADLEGKAWNMSEAFLLSLLDSRQAISRAAITGDVFGWYRCVLDYWNSVYFQFSEEENKSLSEKLARIKNMLNNPQNKYGAQMLQSRIGEVEDALTQVTQLLHVYLNNYERIFKKNRFESWESEVEEDFK